MYIYISLSLYIYIYSIRFAKPGGPVSGFLFSWFWSLGSRVPWFPGSLVPEFLGSRVPWFPSSLVPWFLGFLVPWFSGYLVPWFPVLCRWISLAEVMKNKTECCFFCILCFSFGFHSLSICFEFQWFWVTVGGHFAVILRSRGALESKMAPRGVRVEKQLKKGGNSNEKGTSNLTFLLQNLKNQIRT